MRKSFPCRLKNYYCAQKPFTHHVLCINYQHITKESNSSMELYIYIQMQSTWVFRENPSGHFWIPKFCLQAFSIIYHSNGSLRWNRFYVVCDINHKCLMNDLHNFTWYLWFDVLSRAIERIFLNHSTWSQYANGSDGIDNLC